MACPCPLARLLTRLPTVTAQKPSLELLRRLTDGHVIEAIVGAGRLTRAELAAATGLSKPTVGESIRRLAAAGVVVDTGARSSGPGRAGIYYDLSPTTGTALVVRIAPEGVVAEVVDVRGAVVSREDAAVSRPARPATVARALARTAGGATTAALAEGRGPVRLAVVSAADPVDRATGRLVHLPDSPFLVGALDPAGVLADLVEGPVVVGNDVSWSAAAEQAAADPGVEDFAYLYLGEGLGCAVVAGGEVRTGAGGLAGEVAHVVVTGARGRATPFIEVFGGLGVRHEGSTAIDVARLLDAVSAGGPPGRRGSPSAAGGVPRALAAVATAVADVVAAVVALTDPAVVVLGGPWGSHPRVVEAVDGVVQASARPVPVRAAQVEDPALTGARQHAVATLRSRLVADLP